MTREEFNKARWVPGLIAKYKDGQYPIVAVDFEEALLAITGRTMGTEEPDWVRCENVTIVGGCLA